VQQEKPAIVAESEEYLVIMADEVNHCQNVIRDLLDCARKPEPAYEPTDVKQLVASTIDSVLLDHRGHATTKLHHQVPDSPLIVLGSSSYLKQAFLNILQNSCDAIDERGEVTVRTRRVDGRAEVVFEDTGNGMRKRDQERAFEPLFTTKRPGKGTGLGLAVARDIIEKHRGTIHLESELGQGTKVTVILPLMET
jgi:signal transduction histidine kinase